MNKTKMTFLSGLAMLGLEAKAQEVLVKDLKSQLTKLETAQEAVEKVEETMDNYFTLGGNMTAQKQIIEAEVAELQQSLTELDATAPDFVQNLMDINKQIESKQEIIKAVETGSLTLGQKKKADTADALAVGYKALAELSYEASLLIGEVSQVVNKTNKAQIVQAVRSIANEITGYSYVLRDATQNIKAERVTHNGVRFFYSDLSLENAVTAIEKL